MSLKAMAARTSNTVGIASSVMGFNPSARGTAVASEGRQSLEYRVEGPPKECIEHMQHYSTLEHQRSQKLDRKSMRHN
jgi:hypothetical protein